MKKQFTTPQMDVVKVHPTEIICTSASFGDGDTPIMHAIGRGGFDDDLWDE